MNEFSLMIRNMLDMECDHISKGLITKEFAGNAITAFISGLMVEEKTENEVKSNQFLRYISKWCKIYIENVEVKKE